MMKSKKGGKNVYTKLNLLRLLTLLALVSTITLAVILLSFPPTNAVLVAFLISYVVLNLSGFGLYDYRKSVANNQLKPKQLRPFNSNDIVNREKVSEQTILNQEARAAEILYDLLQKAFEEQNVEMVILLICDDRINLSEKDISFIKEIKNNQSLEPQQLQKIDDLIHSLLQQAFKENDQQTAITLINDNEIDVSRIDLSKNDVDFIEGIKNSQSLNQQKLKKIEDMLYQAEYTAGISV